MSTLQQTTERCVCGRVAVVTPTRSPWEFRWRCACGFAGVISHASVNPPPVFIERQAKQLEMFSEQVVK